MTGKDRTKRADIYVVYAHFNDRVTIITMISIVHGGGGGAETFVFLLRISCRKEGVTLFLRT